MRTSTHSCSCRPEAHGEALLACRGLQVGYGGQALLPPIDLCLSRGELCAAIGRNGAGKIT